MCNEQFAMCNELKTEEYVVAFIDILGASEMIKNSLDESLNAIHGFYKLALGMAGVADSYVERFEVSIFSDNIVLAVKVGENCALIDAFKNLIIIVIALQSILLYRNILCRGGITYGKFFKDDIMVWGDALVRAHELESKIAIFPRIVIDKSLMCKFSDEDVNKSSIGKYFSIDFDGMFFVDFCNAGDNYSKEILDLKTQAGRYISSDKIFQKYNWLIRYLESKGHGYEE